MKLTGQMPSSASLMPSPSRQTERFERLNRPLGLAKGTPLSERSVRQAALPEQPLEGRQAG